MSVNLMQIDHQGREKITSIFQSDEEREFMAWIMNLEHAAPGVTIFVHRLSDPGRYLCSVPCPFERLMQADPNQVPRFCGCLDCVDQRMFLCDYTARVIIPDMRKLIPPELVAHFMKEEEDVLNR